MKRKPKAPVVGDLVVVVFLDHAEDMGALEFRVSGWVRSIDKTSIEVSSWDYADGRKYDNGDPNPKWFSIVRSAIKSIKVVEHQA